MINWKDEAKFVLDALKEDDDLLFRDDAEHTARAKCNKFIEEWGFSYNDIWDLDRSIAMFILPRLAYFLERKNGVPSMFIKLDADGCEPINEKEAIEQWDNILETICKGLHLYIGKSKLDFTEEDKKLWQNAKNYLIEYFECLWN